MDEIKGILLDMQKSISNLEIGQEILNEKIDVVREEVTDQMEELREEVTEQMEELREEVIEKMKELREEHTEELHKINQRLVLYQEDLGKKVDILIDADTARNDLLEIHDSEIRELKQEQFNLTAKVAALETRVIGA